MTGFLHPLRRLLFAVLLPAAGALHAAPQAVPDTLAQRLVWRV